jgi:aspartyl-tRNA(Asn)/glutamyl-tRNA(Gln) amidotransferase subunit B
MITKSMRTKEDAGDYRQIPDPDVPPIKLQKILIKEIAETMPEAPHNKVNRFIKQYGIDEETAKTLTSELELANAYEEVVKSVDSNFASLWMRDELKRVLTYNKFDYIGRGITVVSIVELLNLLQNKEITTKAGQRIVEKMPKASKTPREIAEELGLIGVVKEDEVVEAAKQAIDNNPVAVEDYKEGKGASLNFLVGQVMKTTRGKADPGETVKILKNLLDS